MAVQKGFIYEQNAYKALMEYGISAGAAPAGAAHDRPDLEIKLSKGSEASKKGCELKLSPTAAGSLVCKYYNGKWSLGDVGQDPEKKLLAALEKQYKVLNNMNSSGEAGKNWRGKTPYLQNDASGKKILVGTKQKEMAYKKDIAQFGGQNEIKIAIPGSAIADYYITKKCYYMNVGTHGFYLLGNSDPLKLNSKLDKPIPKFDTSAKAQIRVRCQYKGGGDYQFVMTLDFTSVTKSPYNLAPINSSSDVSIDKKKLDKDPLIQAFRK
jgi:hypothetical protein